MFRAIALGYLLLGIVLTCLVALKLSSIMGLPSPVVPEVLHLMAMPGALLTGFVFDDQAWMQLLIWAGSVLVNFGILTWLVDNLSSQR